MTSFYDFAAERLDGSITRMSRYRGEVVLVVNVASRCGFTHQYDGLERLYRRYRETGFTILGFPCNQFGYQEPGTPEQIADFCRINYQIEFPMHKTVKVNGAGAHPLFTFLKRQAPGLLGTENVKWNFTKFLINRDGQILRRFGSMDTPHAMEPAITDALGLARNVRSMGRSGRQLAGHS